MADVEQVVGDVIRAYGGELVGRVRLHKVMYLLDRLGLRSSFEYDYHHYGPYAESLAVAVDNAAAEGIIEEQILHREQDGMPYSIFRLKRGARTSDKFVGALSYDAAAKALEKMKRHSAIVLELTATINWLIDVEEVGDWKRELKRRKGTKAEGGRMEEAAQLLRELGLPPEKEGA